MSWRQEAACLSADTNLFFPSGTARPATSQVHEAKLVCADCPVREACLAWAVKFDVDHGVWGGLSEEERRSRKRRRARSRTTQPAAGPVVRRFVA